MWFGFEILNFQDSSILSQAHQVKEETKNKNNKTLILPPFFPNLKIFNYINNDSE